MIKKDRSLAKRIKGLQRSPARFLSTQEFSSLPLLQASAADGRPRVAILMADAGGGHRSAARSLAEALAGEAHTTILNLLDEYTPFPFNQLSPTYGPFVNRAPWLYHLVYRATEDRRFVVAAENACYPLVHKRLQTPLVALAPDLVISVHPLLTDVPIRILRRSGLRVPFVTVVTDPVTAHPAWFCPEVDLCVVATEAAYRAAIEAGMSPRQVRVIGLPVRRQFSDVRDEERAAVRARLGLNPDWPMVLLSGGGAGIGKLMPLARTLARRLAEARYPSQMAIIAGRNEQLLRQLHNEPWPIKVIPLGFVEQMADWMKACDLLITKAGPGTLAEAACVGTPVLVTDFIPGQETGNISWIESTGAGAYARDPERVAGMVARWLQPGSPVLLRMAEQARRLANPDATAEIANTVLALCRPSLPL